MEPEWNYFLRNYKIAFNKAIKMIYGMINPKINVLQMMKSVFLKFLLSLLLVDIPFKYKLSKISTIV